MKPSLLFLFIAFSCTFSIGLAGVQRYAVKGKLLCGTAPATGIKVKLYDIDPGLDELLDEKLTGADGTFLVDGSADEVTNIDPVLKVYHDCDDNLPGQRRMKMTLPEKYIKVGGGTPIVLDIGVLNLEAVHHAEERDLI